MSNSTSIMLQVMSRNERVKPLCALADTESRPPEPHLNPGLGAKIGEELKHMLNRTFDDNRLSPME